MWKREFPRKATFTEYCHPKPPKEKETRTFALYNIHHIHTAHVDNKMIHKTNTYTCTNHRKNYALERPASRIRGWYAALQTTLLCMKRLNKTESPTFALLYVLCFYRQSFRFLFYVTAAGVKCRAAAVERLLVLYHRANYTFISFGIIEPFLES